MKTVSRSQMKELDRQAIEEYHIPSLLLMENAGIRTTDIIVQQYGIEHKDGRVLVLCGHGNNGGDGFVVSRHLLNKGFHVTTYVLALRDAVKGDSLTNLIILEKMKSTIVFAGSKHNNSTFKALLKECDFIVDALFGTGLDREIKGAIKTVIDSVNRSEKPVMAIDIPSGLDCDTGEILGAAIRADHTVTLGVAKQGFYNGDGERFAGKIHVVDISIPRELIDMM